MIMPVGVDSARGAEAVPSAGSTHPSVEKIRHYKEPSYTGPRLKRLILWRTTRLSVVCGPM